MKALRKGLLLALIHALIVCSLGAKLLYERATRPRVWVKAAQIDPDLPIRGRYLNLNFELPAIGFDTRDEDMSKQFTTPFNLRCDLQMRDGKLVAVGKPDGQFWVMLRKSDQGQMAVVWPSTPFFIPEHLDLNRLTGPHPNLWVEVTMPESGPPRPIRLGVKNGNRITPLQTE